MAEVTCSFCGRNKKDVDLMISGIHAHICDKCVTQANQILGEEKKSKKSIDLSPSVRPSAKQPRGWGRGKWEEGNGDEVMT